MDPWGATKGTSQEEKEARCLGELQGKKGKRWHRVRINTHRLLSAPAPEGTNPALPRKRKTEAAQPMNPYATDCFSWCQQKVPIRLTHPSAKKPQCMGKIQEKPWTVLCAPHPASIRPRLTGGGGGSQVKMAPTAMYSHIFPLWLLSQLVSMYHKPIMECLKQAHLGFFVHRMSLPHSTQQEREGKESQALKKTAHSPPPPKSAEGQCWNIRLHKEMKEIQEFQSGLL